MSSGSVLPPDVREQMEQQRGRMNVPGGQAGIGGAAPENRANSEARQKAMGNEVEDEEDLSPEEEEKVELKACPGCSSDLQSEWDYCAKCGRDLLRDGAAKRLGVSFSDQDIQDYLFKGYIVRDLKVLGNHTITVKTSQPEDMEKIDDYIMNGEWQKKGGEDKKVSEFHLRQKNQLAVMAANLMKVDGTSIGKDVSERCAWLNKKGSFFVDLVSQRVVLFQQAFTDYLKKEDSILGS